MRPHRPLNVILLIFLLGPSFCQATTAVFAVTRTGIVVGVDSKISRDARVAGQAVPLDKAVIVQDRLLVIAVGLVNFETTRGAETVSYNFAEWIGRIKRKCPKDVSVSALTSLIENESRVTFNNFDRFIRVGAFQRDATHLIEYLIAGYELGVPTVNRVYFDIDWDSLRLDGPHTVPEHSRATSKAGTDFFAAGQNDVVENMRRKDSDAYKEMIALAPKELPKLFSGESLSISESRNVCLAALRYETKHHKLLVAPPYVITIIPPVEMGGITRKTYRR